MRSVVITEDRSLDVAERPSPALAPGRIRVRVAYCGICGSDLHIRTAETIAAGSPVGVVLGHEFVGTVAEVADDVTQWRVGDRVVGWPNGSCGECDLCRAGDVQMCPAKLTEGIGLGRNDGALAESVVMQADRAFAVPDGLNDDHAALTEPLAVALRAVRRGEVTTEERSVVIGAGPVGLMVALALRAVGRPDPLVVEVNEGRADGARGFGFETCRPEELAERSAEVLGGAATVVFECAGHESALPLAIEALHPGGRIVVVGVLMEPVTVSQLLIMAKEATIVGSFGHRTTEFAEALELLATGRIPAEQLITGRVSLEDAERAFDALADPASSHIKILIQP